MTLFDFRFFRSVSYRQFFRLVWGYTGCSKRIPLPCCVYNAIRAEFPSEQGDYHGFEADELEHSAEQEERAGRKLIIVYNMNKVWYNNIKT